MKKLKVAIIATAIFTGVGGAFATNCEQCENSPQFVWTGNGYMRVGNWGEDFDCYVTAGTCTYYQPDPVLQPNNYTPCHIGLYTPL